MDPDKEVKDLKNIIDRAIDDGNFNTLITAIKEVGLDDTLSTDGPFTIFAPTDEAFNKLPKKTLEHILRDKERLTEILTYHILTDKIKSKDIEKINNRKTVQGSQLIFDNSKELMVNKATITHKDIECKNGIIQIIDKVLIPI
jgi:uncharacterized surface protein with fasciclin (FAS1) repeats